MVTTAKAEELSRKGNINFIMNLMLLMELSFNGGPIVRSLYKTRYMKVFSVFLSFLILVSCANGNEKTFIGSTPADPVVRSFLGISLYDSVDFIRWKLVLLDDSYQLQCNYGIGKPNTNGFINGGKKIELSGGAEKEKNYYRLKNGTASLQFVELNTNLLHVLGADKNMLIGNGGWSFTLNNTSPVVTDEISIQSKLNMPEDSIIFEGRTPCKVPGVIPEGTQCYKLKWRITFYTNKEYKILGTAWRKENGQPGHWSITTGKNGRIIYELSDAKGNKILYLLKADENILLFTDAHGNLLTGDEDFSYTLNRR
jgi:hypothetical protein